MDFQAYLVDQQLVTDSPYEQENLNPKEKIAVAQGTVTFENFYRVKGEKIYCHICGSHRHNNGITGLFDNGTRILFGSKCAGEFFGPEVMKLCAGDLRKRTKNAANRFTILKISNSMQPVESWLSSYQHIFSHIDLAWSDIELRYPKPYSEIIRNLEKNNGRLVQSSTITTDGNALRKQIFETSKILTSIRSPEAIPFLKKGQQQIALVSAFISAVKAIRSEPSDQMFSNLANKYRDALKSAENADNIISFTADFFAPEKLAVVSAWYEERRELRLSGRTKITKQDIGKKFSKLMGAGLERPSQSLVSAMQTTQIESSLSQRKELRLEATEA